MLVECGGDTIGAIAVRDDLRPEASAVVAHMRPNGCPIVMLAGDNQATATGLATEAGITEVDANLRPEDKAHLVTELEHRESSPPSASP